MALIFNDNDRFVYPYDRLNALAADYLKIYYAQYIDKYLTSSEVFTEYDVEPVFLGKGFYYSIIIKDNGTPKRLDTETCIFVTKLYFQDILLWSGVKPMTQWNFAHGDDADFIHALTSLIIALDEIVFTYFSHNTSFIQKWKNFNKWVFYRNKAMDTISYQDGKIQRNQLMLKMVKNLFEWGGNYYIKNKRWWEE